MYFTAENVSLAALFQIQTKISENFALQFVKAPIRVRRKSFYLLVPPIGKQVLASLQLFLHSRNQNKMLYRSMLLHFLKVRQKSQNAFRSDLSRLSRSYQKLDSKDVPNLCWLLVYCTTTAFLSDLSRFSNFFQKVFSKFFFFKKLLIFKLFLDSLVSKDVLLTLCWHLVCHCTTWQCHTMYQTDCQKTQFQDIIQSAL